jgi:hypothetical protein
VCPSTQVGHHSSKHIPVTKIVKSKLKYIRFCYCAYRSAPGTYSLLTDHMWEIQKVSLSYDPNFRDVQEPNLNSTSRQKQLKAWFSTASLKTTKKYLLLEFRSNKKSISKLENLVSLFSNLPHHQAIHLPFRVGKFEEF